MSALARIRMENPARKKHGKKKNVGELLIFGNPWHGAGNFSTKQEAVDLKRQLEATGKRVRIVVSAKGTKAENFGVVVLNPSKGFGNHKAGCGCKFCDRAAKLQSGELKPPPLPNRKRRNSKKLDAQRATRDRAATIRAARANPTEAERREYIAKAESELKKARAKYAAAKSEKEKRRAFALVQEWDGRLAFAKNPPSEFVCKRCGKEFTAAQVEAGEYRKHMSAHRAKRSGPRRRRGDRRNPDGDTSQTREAVRLFQGFHGHDPKEIAEKHVSASVRLDYTAIGDLIYVKMLTPLDQEAEFTFDGDGVKLASSPDGKQLYCIGGNQNILPLLEERSTEKDFIDMGECFEVAYLARKIHGDFRPVEYFHEFGEVNGMRPRLMFDKMRKQIFFIGGDYFIDVTMRAPGTPLGKVSPGIEN